VRLPVLGWLFALGVLAHNAEEALFLPQWSASAGRWHPLVAAAEFQFAVAVLSLAVIFCAWAASTGGARSLGAYLLTGYALAMVINVFVPHVLASLALRTYAPGTATALAFNLPLGGWLLWRAITEKFVQPSVFAWSGPLTAIVIATSIPLLFGTARYLSLHSGAETPYHFEVQQPIPSVERIYNNGARLHAFVSAEPPLSAAHLKH
jgi:hypothetical protein